jgi:hypothetical protein
VFDEMVGLADRQADLRNSLLCQLIANIHRDPARPPLMLEDFLLFRAPAAAPDPDEVEANLRLFLHARMQATPPP